MFSNVAIQPFPLIQLICLAKSQRKKTFITDLAFTKEEGFPNKICELCNNLVRKFREFKDVCLQSHEEQQGTRFVRVKRKKKVTESPSIQEQREAKRGKNETERESSISVRQSLIAKKFSLIYPKQNVEVSDYFVEQELPKTLSNSG